MTWKEFFQNIYKRPWEKIKVKFLRFFADALFMQPDVQKVNYYTIVDERLKKIYLETLKALEEVGLWNGNKTRVGLIGVNLLKFTIFILEHEAIYKALFIYLFDRLKNLDIKPTEEEIKSLKKVYEWEKEYSELGVLKKLAEK